MTGLPLTNRQTGDIVMMRASQAVTVSCFFGHAVNLAAELPESARVINLCRDRYAFGVTFAATLIAGGTNLLPANRLPATIDSLRRQADKPIIVSDQKPDCAGHPFIDPTDLLDTPASSAFIPAIAPEQIAAVVFTSGSTGGSSAIEKPWRTLYESSLINVAELGLYGTTTHAVATVPPQHMWGLETSVLAPWFAPLVMDNRQPFFVADIIKALAALPAPRVLVSTPVHLRALAANDHELPAIDTIYSATAPLCPRLAARLEAACCGRLVEIYGSSETGCLARRAAARDDPWQVFSAFSLSADGDSHIAHAAHLPAPVRLMDRLGFASDGRFRLIGRHDDLVNIAGKRASLAELTQILLDIPGVADGVIFQPPNQDSKPVGRLAALVVAPGLTVADVRRQLSSRIDGAFMPRPLNLVDSLPRAETGKLPRQAVIDLHQSLELATS